MSTERRFTEPLSRCRVRRTWGRTLVNLLVLIVLLALSCWLWGCVHGAAVPMLHTELRAGLPVLLAMAPLPLGVMVGALMSLSAMGIAMAVRKMARHNEEARKSEELGGHLASAAPWPADRLGMPSIEEMQRILAALITEASEARRMVYVSREAIAVVNEMLERSLVDLSVEDYGERIDGARTRLKGVSDQLGMALGTLRGVILCQGNLADRVTAAAEPVKPVNVSIKMDASGMQDMLRRNRDMIRGFVGMLTMRASWVRCYHAPAASYRPEHGGYGA